MSLFLCRYVFRIQSMLPVCGLKKTLASELLVSIFVLITSASYLLPVPNSRCVLKVSMQLMKTWNYFSRISMNLECGSKHTQILLGCLQTVSLVMTGLLRLSEKSSTDKNRGSFRPSGYAKFELDLGGFRGHVGYGKTQFWPSARCYWLVSHSANSLVELWMQIQRNLWRL